MKMLGENVTIEPKVIDELQGERATKILKTVLRGLLKVESVELFEDGLSGDLSLVGLNKPAAAYMKGREDALLEMGVVVGEAFLEHPTINGTRAERSPFPDRWPLKWHCINGHTNDTMPLCAVCGTGVGDADAAADPPSADGARVERSQEIEEVAAVNGCPCLVINPCSQQCSCAHPAMSGGCLRCAWYGSLKQREASARRIAAVADAPSQERSSDRFNEYERNLLGSCENWLRSRSGTVWAKEFQHGGLMIEYANDIKAMLAAPLTPDFDPLDVMRRVMDGPQAESAPKMEIPRCDCEPTHCNSQINRICRKSERVILDDSVRVPRALLRDLRADVELLIAGGHESRDMLRRINDALDQESGVARLDVP